MSNATILNDPRKEAVTLLEFGYGTDERPSYASYTDGAEHEPGGRSDAGIFESKPEIEFDLPPQSGTLRNRAAKIIMPRDAFTELVRFNGQTGPVTMWVWERLRSPDVDANGVLQTQLLLFRGRVTRLRNNYRGRSGSVYLEAKSWKDRMDFPINRGLVQHQCIHSFGGFGCRQNHATNPPGINLDVLRVNGNITGIEGKYIISSASDIINKPDDYWIKGTVNVNGTEIGISRYKASDPTRLQLYRPPPADWLNVAAVFTPGCDKLYEGSGHGCEFWNNQQNFCGPGIAVPEYYPPLETGRSG